MPDFSKDFQYYVQTWKEHKTQNDSKFIDFFLAFLNDNLDTDTSMIEVSFDGPGSYFGKQVTLTENAPFAYSRETCLEIAYNSNQLSVYTGRHDGFWVLEYLNLTSEHPEFLRVMKTLMNFLNERFGIINFS